MPDVPTPGVNGQVVGSPALQASKSISSFAPAARTLGLWASTARAGSFCLFAENGDAGLPMDTRVSPAAATAEESANNSDSATVMAAGTGRLGNRKTRSSLHNRGP